MEYTILKLGKLTGVSPRTLRYYDEIGLLKPQRINSSGYRIYGQKQVDLLQQILFYKELGVGLFDIKNIISSPDFDGLSTLKKHRESLLAKRAQLEVLIKNIDKTIAVSEGRLIMTDIEKFEGFKHKLIDDNEKLYGKEAREKYGEKAVDESNRKLISMTKEQYEEFKNLEEKLNDTLKEAVKTGDSKGKLGQKTADLHKRWLCFTWDSYSKEAHAGLANMYVEDDRFKAYYEKIAPGAAEFLKDAILEYTKNPQ